jgi:cell division protein FtsL
MTKRIHINKLIILVTICIIIAGVSILFYTKQVNRTEKPTSTQVDDNKNTEQQRRQLEKDVNSTVNDVANKNPASKSDVINTPKPSLSVRIKSIEQKDRQLYVSLDINDKPETAKCLYKIEKTGQATVEKIINLEGNSCDHTFLDIDQGQQGTWTTTVMVISDKTVASDTREVLLR